jgi:hypothetical protein
MPLLFGSWSAGGALLALFAALVMSMGLGGLFLGRGGGCGLCGISTLACGLSKRKASAQQQCAYNREQLLHSVSLWGIRDFTSFPGQLMKPKQLMIVAIAGALIPPRSGLGYSDRKQVFLLPSGIGRKLWRFERFGQPVLRRE